MLHSLRGWHLSVRASTSRICRANKGLLYVPCMIIGFLRSCLVFASLSPWPKAAQTKRVFVRHSMVPPTWFLILTRCCNYGYGSMRRVCNGSGSPIRGSSLSPTTTFIAPASIVHGRSSNVLRQNSVLAMPQHTFGGLHKPDLSHQSRIRSGEA